MILRRFSLNIIIRILMLLATVLLLAFTLRNPSHFFSISFYALLLAIQVVLLIRSSSLFSQQKRGDQGSD